MILRRIGQAVRRQDWFVVFIELMIVVVGIYIGLQVDDWQQQREDRRDEQEFVARLHEDLLLSEELASRLLQRRLTLVEDLASATDVIFERVDRDVLTEEECSAIGNSRFFNIVISDLPSVTELLAAGRLDIIEDADLRFAVISLQQKSRAVQEMIPFHTLTRSDLPNQFPEIIPATSYYDEELGEYQQRYGCDLQAMRESVGFRSGVSLNMDGYDAYLRDLLRPWAEQFERVHALVDADLGITHAVAPGNDGP